MAEYDATIPFIDLKSQQARIRDRIETRIRSVLDHGRYIMGPEVGELEEKLALFTDAKHVVTCSNGTDALWLALLALGIGRDDAVFVPSWTFTATAEAVCLTGATPVFVDVDPRFHTMDPENLKASVEMIENDGSLQPKAIIPVDLFGIPAPYPEINGIAERKSMSVIGDAAQSLGAKIGNLRVGALTHITTTSFFPAKPLGCYGDGGAIFVDDADIDEILRSLRVHGRSFDNKYDNIRIGTNARLDTLQAAILLEKLTIFEDELERRQEVAARYSTGLDGLVDTPTLPNDKTSAWAQYTIQTDERDALADALKRRNIPATVYYPKPLHLQPPYIEHPRSPGGLSTTESLAARVLSLPMSPYLEESDQDRIIDAVRAFRN